MDGFVKFNDRDVSILIYLDDGYKGGELPFNRFDFRLRPKAGMLVYFPSHSGYLHTACEVTRGISHAIVSWLSQSGVEKILLQTEDAILL